MGALLQLGLSVEELNKTLHQFIPAKNWKIVSSPVERHLWPALSITIQGDRPFGSVATMIDTVRRSACPKPVQRSAIAAFRLLERAQAESHGGTYPGFQDKGLALLDTWVDVLGTVWGFWRLGLNAVRASPVRTGRLSPAGAWLVRHNRIPVYSDDNRFELATPTGLALLATLAKEFGSMPSARLARSGYGAGRRDLSDRANVIIIHEIHRAGDVSFRKKSSKTCESPEKSA